MTQPAYMIPDVPPHVKQDCRWQHCPLHNPTLDPFYTPALQWPESNAIFSPDAQLMHETYEQYRERLSAAAAIDSAEPGRDNIVAVCSWCPHLHILSLDRREADTVTIYQHGKKLYVMRNGRFLVISHRMCKSCESKQRAQRKEIEAPGDLR